MQTIFESGEEDYFFLNPNNTLNNSISDLFFDNIIQASDDFSNSSGSVSPNESLSPINLNYSINPISMPVISFKQETHQPPKQNSSQKIDNKETNKRKRNVKNEKEKEKEKDKSNKNQAPKKIRKKHPEMQTAVTLSREKLLTTSTEEFNKWVEELKSSRSLTQEEVQDIRRQKRLIRNRESAQASRDRKKNEFSLLEKQIQQLKEEKEMALRELNEMKSKVSLLESENLYMKTTIQHNPVLNEIYHGIGNIQTKNSFISEKGISKSVKNAGVCLFLLIFSFGLFFNVQNALNQSQPTNVYLPQNIPRVVSTPNNQPTTTLRTLGTNARKLLSKTKTQLSDLNAYEAIPNETQNTQVIPLLVENVEINQSIVVKKENIITNETVLANPQMTQPNVHLYCLSAKEYIINPTIDAQNLTISLMIPRTSISPNSPILNNITSNDDLIEVFCKVLPQKYNTQI